MDGKINYIHKVFIPDNIKLWPSVDHRTFKVDFFSTGHIARVNQEIDRTFLSKYTLHPQWHLDIHYLYESTHQVLFTDNSRLYVLKSQVAEKGLTDRSDNQTGRLPIINLES